ncbi:isopentenyl-diphosphate Delta-isomerase [Actinotalea sp. M2MS4P-6]|uniref:isopentenyl-diphosphate Delta-isomerase n=1 Tax=Actinotalea sp. M2MS4P-6 TaxID=2983762 RepID=UPI0021E4E445|nr:isopentenyl-diphosphate Delta-isomerase [Actinotalea sp. M2MS4P-6]MCV2393024.1 isopentenyl-diphosphate Delta-isomerase [Actinotalea sp. M2MS4P-6]
MDQGAELVVLLDASGVPSGTAAKSEVHTACTPLHLAFSCHVVDEAGNVLVTRRALTKKTWPGVWTNSVCGHPGPGEDTADAVRRRARDELGLELAEISPVLPDFRYRATDASGVVENEVCPVVVARPAPGATVRPNPDEVMDHVWVPIEDLLRAIEVAPWALSPWLVQAGPGLRTYWSER